MIKIGYPPYLECSSKGDTRFSAFYAKPICLASQSIEEAYQGMKVFADGTTDLSWRQAKGRKAVNHEACAEAYALWWQIWVDEQGLLPILKQASGLSDTFGRAGSVCQALVLWEIRNGYLDELAPYWR